MQKRRPQSRSINKEHKSFQIGLFSVFLVFYTTWGFGLPAVYPLNLGPGRVVIQVIFIIANISLGVLMIVVFCALSKEIRKTWMKILCRFLLCRRSKRYHIHNCHSRKSDNNILMSYRNPTGTNLKEQSVTFAFAGNSFVNPMASNLDVEPPEENGTKGSSCAIEESSNGINRSGDCAKESGNGVERGIKGGRNKDDHDDGAKVSSDGAEESCSGTERRLSVKETGDRTNDGARGSACGDRAKKRSDGEEQGIMGSGYGTDEDDNGAKESCEGSGSGAKEYNDGAHDGAKRFRSGDGAEGYCNHLAIMEYF